MTETSFVTPPLGISASTKTSGKASQCLLAFEVFIRVVGEEKHEKKMGEGEASLSFSSQSPLNFTPPPPTLVSSLLGMDACHAGHHSSSLFLVSLAAVFSVVTQRSSPALRDDTEDG